MSGRTKKACLWAMTIGTPLALALTWVVSHSSASVTNARTVSNAPSALAPQTIAADIAERHLFGEFVSTGAAQESAANFRLVGVFAAPSGQRSAALLSANGGPLQAVLEGGTTNDGWRLDLVHPDRVELILGDSRTVVALESNP